MHALVKAWHRISGYFFGAGFSRPRLLLGPYSRLTAVCWLVSTTHSSGRFAGHFGFPQCPLNDTLLYYNGFLFSVFGLIWFLPASKRWRRLRREPSPMSIKKHGFDKPFLHPGSGYDCGAGLLEINYGVQQPWLGEQELHRQSSTLHGLPDELPRFCVQEASQLQDSLGLPSIRSTRCLLLRMWP